MAEPELPADARVVRDAEGRIRLAGLPSAAWVAGLPCRAGSVVHFHESGRLAQADLGQAHVICDFRFELGTVVTFDEEGALDSVLLTQPHELAGRSFPGGVLTFDPAGTVTEWTHEGTTRDIDGHVRRARLDVETMIDGVTCAAGTNAVYFASGRLQDAILGREHAFGPIALPAGSHVGLDEDGSLRSALLIEPLELDGAVYPAGAVLSFDAAGSVIGVATFSAEPVAPVSPAASRGR